MKYLIIFALLFVFGCAQDDSTRDRRIHIISTSSWVGHINNTPISGNGDTIINVPDESGVCCEIRKLTDNSFTLRVTMLPDGQYEETRAPFGQAVLCVE